MRTCRPSPPRGVSGVNSQGKQAIDRAATTVDFTSFNIIFFRGNILKQKSMKKLKKRCQNSNDLCFTFQLEDYMQVFGGKPIKMVIFYIKATDVAVKLKKARCVRNWEEKKSNPWPGLPDGLFSNQTPSFGTFWKPFERKIFKSFMTIWYTLCPYALFYGNLACVVAIRCIIPILVHCFKKNLATLPLAFTFGIVPIPG
jgi:hypothetical protein